MVRVLNVEQGSREWIEARLGIPTASQFGRIVTATGRLSKQRETYMAELLAEWVFGEPKDDLADNKWVQRGAALEPQARRYYALQTDSEPETVGLCLTDDGTAGASPDGLVGADGLLELKCPAEYTHLLWLARGGLPTQHVAQVQGQLWVTGRCWADFMSYCPELPPLLVSCKPDEQFQAALDAHIPTFHAELMAGRERLLAVGVQRWEKLG